LESAISSVSDRFDVSVSWMPYFLRPDRPREGVLKSPDTPDNPRVGARMKAAGASVGIDFTGKCDRSPNTLLAHCLLDYAEATKGASVQNDLAEVLFRNYFTDGVYPDVDNLCEAAAEVGLDRAGAREHIENTKVQDKVYSAGRAMSRQGVRGVPYFLMNDQPIFSGAQNPESFVAAFEEVTK